MEDLLKAISSNFPNIVLLIFFVVALNVVFRQYVKLQEGIEKKVSDAVSSKIGEILGSLQAEIARAETFSRDQKLKLDEISSTHDSLKADILQKHENAVEKFDEVEAKFADLIRSIPDMDQYSAEDLLLLAKRMDGIEAAQLCAKILDHKDATSLTLEMAGDQMRRASRYTLARNLYEKAAEVDPESAGAYVESRTLKAQIEPLVRERVLAEAIEFVLKNPQMKFFVRVVNSLVELDRYADLLDFCTKFLELTKGKNKLFESGALRNIGTAHKNLGNVELSETFFRSSYELTPNDENSVKFYASSLEGAGKIDECIDMRKKLVIMDSTDISYYKTLINTLIEYSRYSEASEWLDVATNVATKNSDKVSLEEFAHRIYAGLQAGKLA